MLQACMGTTFPLFLSKFQPLRNAPALFSKVSSTSTWHTLSTYHLYLYAWHVCISDATESLVCKAKSVHAMQVISLFEQFEVLDYARTGSKATGGFELVEGPVEGPTGPLAHTLEPLLRRYGMPTKLNKGVVELIADHVVCKQGDTLTPGQAALLRVFDIKMAAFKMTLLCCWEAEGAAWILKRAFLGAKGSMFNNSVLSTGKAGRGGETGRHCSDFGCAGRVIAHAV